MVTPALAETDPTRPFGHSARSSVTPDDKKLILESIIHGEGIHTVVINGEVLKTLDYIGEYQLTAVNDQNVILRSKTKHLKLHLFKSDLVKIKVN
jgi:MSHA biogenesis protein MshK